MPFSLPRLARHRCLILLLTLLALPGLLALPLPSQASLDPDLLTCRADRIVVNKGTRTLTLLAGDMPLRTYRVSLGRNPVGPKVRAGDGRTPEGRYYIEGRNPNSRYHLALRLSYPGPGDRQRALAMGVHPGNDILIHGLGPEKAFLGVYHAYLNWTLGCIAVTDEEIEEIWHLVPDGTPVDIVP